MALPQNTAWPMASLHRSYRHPPIFSSDDNDKDNATESSSSVSPSPSPPFSPLSPTTTTTTTTRTSVPFCHPSHFANHPTFRSNVARQMQVHYQQRQQGRFRRFSVDDLLFGPGASERDGLVDGVSISHATNESDIPPSRDRCSVPHLRTDIWRNLRDNDGSTEQIGIVTSVKDLSDDVGSADDAREGESKRKRFSTSSNGFASVRRSIKKRMSSLRLRWKNSRKDSGGRCHSESPEHLLKDDHTPPRSSLSLESSTGSVRSFARGFSGVYMASPESEGSGFSVDAVERHSESLSQTPRDDDPPTYDDAVADSLTTVDSDGETRATAVAFATARNFLNEHHQDPLAVYADYAYQTTANPEASSEGICLDGLSQVEIEAHFTQLDIQGDFHSTKVEEYLAVAHERFGSEDAQWRASSRLIAELAAESQERDRNFRSLMTMIDRQ